MSDAKTPRPRRDWGDEDDDAGRPKSGGGVAVVLIVLALGVAGLCVIGLVGGAVVWLFMARAADQPPQAEAEIARAEARMREMQERDDLPEPPAAPPPQPREIPFPMDRDGSPGRWTVLFRSKDPALWNADRSHGNDDDFALPVQQAPSGVKYLRLRRMNTGESLIIRLNRGQIAREADVNRLPGWNGTAVDRWGGRHLGIVDGPRLPWQTNKGAICVQFDGFDAFSGSGFGHKHHGEDAGQCYVWKGKQIPPTPFEVAVTSAELSEAERRCLVGGQ